jgi:hypothetical protein
MRIILKTILLSTLVIYNSSMLAQDDPDDSPWASNISKPTASDETSLKIIALHLKARGGEEKLAQFKGLKAEGQLIEGKLDYAIEALFRAPDALIIKSTRRHLGDDYVNARATNGSDAWHRSYLPDRSLPANLNADDERDLEIMAGTPFMFLNAKTSGNVFAYRGERKFSGKPVYIVHVWLKSGHRVEAFFDSKSFHIINYRQVHRFGQKKILVDRVPTGLTRIGETWWEEGYKYGIRGKFFREFKFPEIKQTPDPGLDLFNMPPSGERWIRATSGD